MVVSILLNTNLLYVLFYCMIVLWYNYANI
jgi:hypothetical protein